MSDNQICSDRLRFVDLPTPGNDLLAGEYGNDFVYGEAGQDRLYGAVEGYDGDPGADTLVGGDGDDTVLTECSFADAAAMIDTRGGDDIVALGAGFDPGVFSASATATVITGRGEDRVTIGSRFRGATATVLTGHGNDTVGGWKP